MSGSYQKRVRAPWWDELKNKNASAVQKRDQYIYTLFLEDEKKYVTFSIPEKMLNCLVDGAELWNPYGMERIRKYAVYTDFQTRLLVLLKFRFFIFPAKGSLKNPYKNAMVDDFWKNSKKSIFLLLYDSYRIIRILNPTFVYF